MKYLHKEESSQSLMNHNSPLQYSNKVKIYSHLKIIKMFKKLLRVMRFQKTR